jgi:hypothetical protein
MASAPTLRTLLLTATCAAALTIAGCGGGQPDTDGSSAENVVPASEVERRVAAAKQRLTQNEGGRRVLRAIEAHGGLAAWYRAPTSSYTWMYANKDIDVRFKSFLVVDNRTREAYHDLLTTGSYGDARPVDARFAWDGERAWIAPDSIQQPNPRFWALSGFYFQQIPFVLADPGLTYEALPDDSIDGTPHDMVRVGFQAGVGDTPDDTYTLYLDKETGRVDAIRYTVSYGRDVEDPSALPETFFDYQDDTTVHDLTVPTRFEGYTYSEAEGIGDTLKSKAAADSLSYRRPFEAATLEPPADARVVSLPGTGGK